MSVQEPCRFHIHRLFSSNDLYYTPLFESWPFRGPLDNYNQSNAFVLSWFTARPPPLDLSGLSTITECPTHLPLSRAMTESWWEKKVSLSTKPFHINRTVLKLPLRPFWNALTASENLKCDNYCIKIPNTYQLGVLAGSCHAFWLWDYHIVYN